MQCRPLDRMRDRGLPSRRSDSRPPSSGPRPAPPVHRVRRPTARDLLLAAALAAPALAASVSGCRPTARADAPAPPRTIDFAAQVATLSEPGGYFDSDNLISNERSYLHVVGALRRLNVRGGAYIGVGPDQNYSYIAHVRPSIAFMLDIRRDNLLEHLLFKSLFGAARTRIEYLALLTGRPVPTDVDAWRERPLEAIVAYLDSTPATRASEAAARALALEGARRTRVPLSEADVARAGATRAAASSRSRAVGRRTWCTGRRGEGRTTEGHESLSRDGSPRSRIRSSARSSTASAGVLETG